MAPCDFWLFPRLKMPLKVKKFDNIDTIKETRMKHLSSIQKDSFKNVSNNGRSAAISA
jgi:hypothetical protein